MASNTLGQMTSAAAADDEDKNEWSSESKLSSPIMHVVHLLTIASLDYRCRDPERDDLILRADDRPVQRGATGT